MSPKLKPGSTVRISSWPYARRWTYAGIEADPDVLGGAAAIVCRANRKRRTMIIRSVPFWRVRRIDAAATA